MAKPKSTVRVGVTGTGKVVTTKKGNKGVVGRILTAMGK